jgi:hypothetical protein
MDREETNQGVEMPEWAILGAALVALVGLNWSAARFVGGGVEYERQQLAGGLDYDARHVRVATVHARQDIIGLYHLASLAISLLVLLTALVAIHVVHHW